MIQNMQHWRSWAVHYAAKLTVYLALIWAFFYAAHRFQFSLREWWSFPALATAVSVSALLAVVLLELVDQKLPPKPQD